MKISVFVMSIKRLQDHIARHPIAGTDITVHTHSLVVKNIGRKPAKNVRLGHNNQNFSFNIDPETRIEENLLSNGGKEICIPQLLPGEQYSISYLYFPPTIWVHINLYVKSDEMQAEEIKFMPDPNFPKWFSLLLLFFIFIGITTIIYWLFELIVVFASFFWLD